LKRTSAAAMAWGLVLLFASYLPAADVTPLPIGSAAPDFNLPGVDGASHTLHEYDKYPILVLIFTCNHCPTAQAYEDRIIKLDADYRDKGVKLIAINPNNPEAIRLDELGYTDISDSLDEMKIRAKERGFKFPYLFDGQTQTVAHAYGVIATPHVFIFDADRKLRYQGRIDDSEVKEVHQTDARNAIEALLAHKSVPVETTRVFGCSTKWIDKTDSARKAVEKWNAQPVELSPIDIAGLKKLAANDSQNLRLVNVWATWCGPCVAEMPELVKIPQMYHTRRFEFVTISADSLDRKDAALKLLKENHVAVTNYIVTSDDHDAVADALDKPWQGPLPHTLLIAPSGKVIYRHTGELDMAELKRAIVGYLGRTYASK
jgi:peroxiredoxin